MAISLNSPKYADANSLAYQMHKKQQDRKKRKSLLRHFRRNEGTTDYAQFAAPIALTGNFDVRWKFATTTTNNSTLWGEEFGVKCGMAPDGRLSMFVGNGVSWVVTGISSLSYNDGIIREAAIRKTGNLYELLVDGLVIVTRNNATAVVPTITDIYRRSTGGENFFGSIIDLEVWGSGTLITDCPINEPSGATIIDKASGNNATIINGLDADRGLFKEQPTLWKGQNLAVPPWDSVDQELIKA